MIFPRRILWNLLMFSCLTLLPTCLGATDQWISHVTSHGEWKTALSVFYSGPEASVSLRLSRMDDSGTLMEPPLALQAVNNQWTLLPDSFLAYTGSARIQSEHALLVKVSYRYGNSESLYELGLNEESRLDWVLPNRILPWLDWTGIAFVNPNEVPVTVLLEAWQQGTRMYSRSATLPPRSRYVTVSEAIWPEVTYRQFDTVILRSSMPIPAPIGITGNRGQDRHLFFNAQPKPMNSRPLCLVHGTLVDGTGREPIRDSVVIILDGRIQAVGKSSEIPLPRESEILELHDCTLLPGFINTHVHNAFKKENLRTWAKQGVTTVRDVGAAESTSLVFRFRDEVRADPSCARVVTAGPLITVPGGYPLVPNNFPALAVTSAEDARQKVTELIHQGAELVKITLETGSGVPTLSREEVQGIVDAAHLQGVPVTAHMGWSRFFQLALDTGVDEAAHSSIDYLSDELIQGMIRAGMVLVPTLMAQRKTGETVSNLRRFITAGGKVALGNDGGYVAGMEIGMPLTEIEAMHQAGMSPMQIIQAATKNAAEACRLAGELGTIETGKRADIVVIQGNPLENLATLFNVYRVIHEGVVIR